jgi:hypothetical protein
MGECAWQYVLAQSPRSLCAHLQAPLSAARQRAPGAQRTQPAIVAKAAAAPRAAPQAEATLRNQRGSPHKVATSWQQKTAFVLDFRPTRLADAVVPMCTGCCQSRSNAQCTACGPGLQRGGHSYQLPAVPPELCRQGLRSTLNRFALIPRCGGCWTRSVGGPTRRR